MVSSVVSVNGDGSGSRSPSEASDGTDASDDGPTAPESKEDGEASATAKEDGTKVGEPGSGTIMEGVNDFLQGVLGFDFQK